MEVNETTGVNPTVIPPTTAASRITIKRQQWETHWARIEPQLQAFMAHVKADYPKDAQPGEVNIDMDMEIGYKFIKFIVVHPGGARSVHSFVAVMPPGGKATGKFQVGDLLKAASYRAPLLNFPRGSILDPTTWSEHVRWTGVQ